MSIPLLAVCTKDFVRRWEMRRPGHHDPHERVYDDWMSRFFWFAYHLGTLAEWLALTGGGDYEGGGR